MTSEWLIKNKVDGSVQGKDVTYFQLYGRSATHGWVMIDHFYAPGHNAPDEDCIEAAEKELQNES